MTDRPALISVIISTYNWPEALEKVLASLSRQNVSNFEVVIADDGSAQKTEEIIKSWQADFPVVLHHVWQEDKGFRAAAARNRAVAESRGDYLVFLDGDCVVFSDFVETHARLAESNCFVVGNRILLGESLAAEVIAGDTGFDQWCWWHFLQARMAGKVNRLLPLLKLPDGGFRKFRRQRWQGAMTCNLAVWRENFYQVNGFDEDFVGWGHEDAEFVVRLINSGIYRKEGRFAVPVMHLWHPIQDRAGEEENLRRLSAHMSEQVTRAKKGIDGY